MTTSQIIEKERFERAAKQIHDFCGAALVQREDAEGNYYEMLTKEGKTWDVWDTLDECLSYIATEEGLVTLY